MAEELGKRGLAPEAPGDASRMQLVSDMAGDAERDAVRDAAAFVDGVCASCFWQALFDMFVHSCLRWLVGMEHNLAADAFHIFEYMLWGSDAACCRDGPPGRRVSRSPHLSQAM